MIVDFYHLTLKLKGESPWKEGVSNGLVPGLFSLVRDQYSRTSYFVTSAYTVTRTARGKWPCTPPRQRPPFHCVLHNSSPFPPFLLADSKLSLLPPPPRRSSGEIYWLTTLAETLRMLKTISTSSSAVSYIVTYPCRSCFCHIFCTAFGPKAFLH